MRSFRHTRRVVLFVSCLGLSSGAQDARDPYEGQLLHKKWQECVATCKLQIAPAHGKLRMLTGRAPTQSNPDSSYYFKVGKAIGTSMSTMDKPAERLQIEEIPTCQTTCNLLGLQTGNIELALVQSDVAHDAWYGHPPIAGTPANDLKLVAQLYVEAAHVLVRPHLNVATLKDLRGRRVWLGPKDSFTALTARRILDAAGLTHEDIDALENQCPRPSYFGQPVEHCQKVKELNVSEALEKLANLELDAIFQVGPVPLDPVRDVLVPKADSTPHLASSSLWKRLKDIAQGIVAGPCAAIQKARREDPHLRDREIRLFNLDVDLVERLVRDGSYIEQLIGGDVYCQDKASLTVGVRALLLTNQNSNDPAIKTLTNSLFKRPDAFERELHRQVTEEQKRHGHPEDGIPSELGLLRVAVTDSLEVRQVEHPPRIWPWLRGEVMFLIAGPVIIVGLLHRFRRVMGPFLARRGELIIGVLGLLLAWFGAAVLLRIFEGHVNQSYATFPDAMLSTLIDLSPGGDQPVTKTGQLYWTVWRWVAGFFFWGMVITQFRRWIGRKLRIFQSWLISLSQPRRHPPALSDVVGQAVILNNHPEKTQELIRDLQAGPRAEGQAILIVAQTPVNLPALPEYAGVKVVQGEPSNEKWLRRAHVEKARSITIVSAWPNPNPERRRFLRGDLADSRTIEALRAIRSVCGKNHPTLIRAELQLRKNGPAAQDAAGGGIEIIYEEDSRVRGHLRSKVPDAPPYDAAAAIQAVASRGSTEEAGTDPKNRPEGRANG